MFRYMVTPFIVLLIAITATNAQTQGSYIGCFNDNSYGNAGPVSRDFSVLLDEGNDRMMVPSKCASMCANAGYFYAGLQAGRQCWCGNSYGSYCQTPESQCNPCIANNAFNCGSSNVNAVYVAKPGGSGQSKTCKCGASTQNLCLSPPVVLKYLGCFSDDYFGYSTGTGMTNRDLAVLVSSNGASAIDCVERCVNGNYYYAGVQSGGECWCSNAKYGSFCAADESSCSVPCSTDSSKTCGGVNFNAIYAAAAGGPGQTATCACGNPGKCPNNTFSVSASISSFGCATAPNTLSWSVSASNGVGPYKYSIDGSKFSANTQYNRVRQGNSTITAQDATGINVTTTFFVGPATSVSLSFVPDVSYGFATSSPGASDGYLKLQAQAGQPPYTYALYPSSTALNAYRTTGTASAAATIRNLEAGDYIAIATDANNCQSSPISVRVNTPVLAAPPRNIVVGVTSVDTVVTATAKWDAPTNSGYAAITGYSVQWGYWNGTDIVYNPVETVASATASTIIPILQSTRRFVRLATINSVGVGDYRAPYEFQGLCDAGRYSTRTNCSYCPAGTSTRGTIGRDQCRGCLSGTYSKEGAATCSPCVNNTYSSYAASSCQQCSAGYIAAESYCQPCNPGTYNPTSTTTTCLTCPANTYSSRSGSTSCTPCPATYTSTPGSSYCVDSTGYKK